MNTLQIERIYDTTRLAKLISTVNNAANTQTIRGNVEIFPEFAHFFEMLSWLSRMSISCSQLLGKEKIGVIGSEDSVIEMELVDYDLSADTITSFLSKFTALHADVALALQTNSKLKVLYLDSGTNVRFGFEMAKPVAAVLSKLALQIWEKFRYRRYDNFDREIESLTKGLDFMDTLKQQIDNGAVGAEDGQILRQRVVRNMRAIIGLGGMLPLENAGEQKLLAEAKEVKLLNSGEPPTGSDTPQSE